MDTVEEEEENMWDLPSEKGHEHVWDTQFLEAVSAAMDAVEEQKSMWNQPPPPFLESLE